MTVVALISFLGLKMHAAFAFLKTALCLSNVDCCLAHYGSSSVIHYIFTPILNYLKFLSTSTILTPINKHSQMFSLTDCEKIPLKDENTGGIARSLTMRAFDWTTSYG